MIRRSCALALALVVAITAVSSALAAHPTSRSSVGVQTILTTKQYLQSINAAKATGPTAVARAKAEAAEGDLSPMPW